MKAIRNIALLGVLLGIFFIPAAVPSAHAQVAVGVGFGYPGYYAYGPPACEYGYYGYAPYACAPYGYYGPSYFVGGVFIGAGPWFRGGYGYGYRGGYGFRGGYGIGYRGGYAVGGFRGNEGFRGASAGGFRGASVGGGFHGGGGRR